MAEFEPAFVETMKHEGGYANNPADPGGETYKGIARNYWPKWAGWKQIDGVKAQTVAQPTFGTPEYRNWVKYLDGVLAKFNALQASVARFYRDNFWSPLMAEIPDQDLASWLFDKSVNMGHARANKLLQRALHVDADGVIGPQTRAMLHAADPTALLAACREEAKRYYTQLALKDPSKSQFLHGWLARA